LQGPIMLERGALRVAVGVSGRDIVRIKDPRLVTDSFVMGDVGSKTTS
jgi:hypothetical protein